MISIHALRVEGDLCCIISQMADRGISIHALRVEGDGGRAGDRNTNKISIHALRVEGDRIKVCAGCITTKISIHALRVEGDVHRLRLRLRGVDFYPRPPGGGRQHPCGSGSREKEFLSTPSGWRATGVFARILLLAGDFYPRPPGGGRQANGGKRWCASHFYPRPPGGGRPFTPATMQAISHFYPRPPGGGRLSCPSSPGGSRDFYPRPPGGGRRCLTSWRHLIIIFLSTPSGWRATCRVFGVDLIWLNFYPRPPGGGRQLPAVPKRIGRSISIHALRVEGDTGVQNPAGRA